jgi:hypothetical protein
MREEQTLAEVEDFLEGFNQPTYRGMRINGFGWLRGPPSTGGQIFSRRPVDPFGLLVAPLAIAIVFNRNRANAQHPVPQ